MEKKTFRLIVTHVAGKVQKGRRKPSTRRIAEVDQNRDAKEPEGESHQGEQENK